MRVPVVRETGECNCWQQAADTHTRPVNETISLPPQNHLTSRLRSDPLAPFLFPAALLFMENIKSRVKEKISSMFERKEEDTTDSESGSDEEDVEEEERRRRHEYTSLAGRSMSHCLVGNQGPSAPSPPVTSMTPSPSPRHVSSPSPLPQHPHDAQQEQESTASRAMSFFRRKSDPRGTNQSRERADREIRRELQVPLIVHRRRPSIALTK